jgi:hypothetical protein
MKGIGGIAPGAAQRASGQPDKQTELSGVARLALNAIKDFGHSHMMLKSESLQVIKS